MLTGKTVFYSVQYKNGWLAASDLFDVFTRLHNQLSSIIYCITDIKSTDMFGKCDSSNRLVATSSKFYGKIWVGFCLNTGKRFFLEISL